MGIGIKGFGGTSGGVKGTRLLPPAAVATKGIFGPVGPVEFRFWRLETQGAGSGGAGNSISELKMTFNNSSNLLDSFTLTSIGGTFSSSFRLTNINDGIAERSNTVSFGSVLVANGDMDFYVDFGENSGKIVTVYSIAPQGNVDSSVFNTPVGFNAYSSNDAVSWTLIKSFSGITTGIGSWNPGTFRNFDLITGEFD